MAKASGGALWTLTGLVGLLILSSGCGVTDGLDRLQETIDESLEEIEAPTTAGTVVGAPPLWLDYSSPDGIYSVVFPVEPEYDETEQDGREIRIWSSEIGRDGYVTTELILEPGAVFDLQAALGGALEAAAAFMADETGGVVDYQLIDESSTEIAGNQGLRYLATFDVDGEPFATLRSSSVVVDDLVVALTAVDIANDNPADSERFIDSLKLLP